MEKKNFNEVLKEREERQKAEEAKRFAADGEEHVALDDAKRVKVLSPGRLIFKRFIRNRLAIVGSAILIFMFLFCFLGAAIYPYNQTDRFYKYDYQEAQYAGAQRRTDFNSYVVEGATVDPEAELYINSGILTIEKEQTQDTLISVANGDYILEKYSDQLYQLRNCSQEAVASFASSLYIGQFSRLDRAVLYADGVDSPGDDFFDTVLTNMNDRVYEFDYNGQSYFVRNPSKTSGEIFRKSDSAFSYTGESLGTGFESAAMEAADSGATRVEFGGESFILSESYGVYTVSRGVPADVVLVSTNYVFNAYETGVEFTDGFKAAALLSLINDEPFEQDGVTYTTAMEDDTPVISVSDGTPVAELSAFVVRGADGKDSFDIDFKEKVEEAVMAMEEAGLRESTMTYSLPKKLTEVDENGTEKLVYETDANGNQVYEETVITIKKEVNDYVLTCPVLRHLIDIKATPSAEHPFGTDSDGYDVLSRMMYGGRISLLVGFVVVILETLLGTIMGGIAGYFGGWVDNLIMRMVDIFYCIPSMPILIILGSFMDSQKVNPYVRLMWLMAILGILGWAGVARLVRGQILSLREQEFMVATEATGVRVNKRIFRHLIPNVMPQLIVTATAGLGSVILTESTLSFLGLGVKHPLATWGTMINSVTQKNEDMIKYTYIWIPVGLLICLTVIAFNFVGDGLRDAFDPKMKK